MRRFLFLGMELPWQRKLKFLFVSLKVCPVFARLASPNRSTAKRKVIYHLDGQAPAKIHDGPLSIAFPAWKKSEECTLDKLGPTSHLAKWDLGCIIWHIFWSRVKICSVSWLVIISHIS